MLQRSSTCDELVNDDAYGIYSVSSGGFFWMALEQKTKKIRIVVLDQKTDSSSRPHSNPKGAGSCLEVQF